MARKIAIGLVVLSLAVIGSIDATATAGSGHESQAVGVRFTPGSMQGLLEIANGAGFDMEAYNESGMPVAAGMIPNSYAMTNAEAGFRLHVRVGNRFFECNASSPDWNWDG